MGQLLVGLLVAAIGVSGCGGQDRSVAAVCHVWDTDGLSFHDQWQQLDSQMNQPTGSSLLQVLGSALAAPNDLSVLFQKLANAAPGDIQPDFQTIADLFKQEAGGEAGDVTHPLSGALTGLMGAIGDSGSFNRVNAYLGSNCGIPHDGSGS